MVKNIIYGILVGLIIPSIFFKFDIYVFIGAIIGGFLALIFSKNRRNNSVKYEKR